MVALPVTLHLVKEFVSCAYDYLQCYHLSFISNHHFLIHLFATPACTVDETHVSTIYDGIVKPAAYLVGTQGEL